MQKFPSLKIKTLATVSRQAVFTTESDIVIDEIVIPKGTETDGASLPRWAIFSGLILVIVGGLSGGILADLALILGWLTVVFAYLFPPFGKYALAAILHDYLLTIYSRDQADSLMKDYLPILGVDKFWQFWMYKFVRLNSTFKDRVMG